MRGKPKRTASNCRKARTKRQPLCDQSRIEGQDKARKKLLAEDWQADYWKNRCAWCSCVIQDLSSAFIIPVSLYEEAFREFDRGSIQPLYLCSINRVAPMIVATEDSPIRESGKDAYFQTCSEKCALALKKALQDSLNMAVEE